MTAISWGDVPTWVAAIGTTGTLATGMFIILRDRLNQYRSLVDELDLAILPQHDATQESWILTIQNPCSKPFFYLDLYFQTDASFRDGTHAPVGCHYFSPQLGPHTTAAAEHIFRDVDKFDVGQSAIFTYRITDTAGRRWLKVRRKPAKLVTWRNSKLVDSRLRNLESEIRENSGTRYIEAPLKKL